ncbi:SAM-dependent methyltransferase [Streptosporangium sp. NBC_01469]|uniref:SAM-dependent methyltransferase n=2 Tax=unclassified Streptosporangium TaxID=2632669 RepID=UPI002E2C4185|nr:SAM-dependent methyltransferase [Streptosporangium sp. NBC_01469]
MRERRGEGEDMTEHEQAPPGIDPTIPSVARMYDYYLGGKDNFASDRIAGEKIVELVPNVKDVARSNRAFLGRTVRHLAAAGIRQFIDIGTGLPTQENVHQVVLREAPDSQIVYVDNDPIVLVHARALLADNARTIVIPGDLREPGAILDHPDVRERIDFDQPVAVLMVSILHFVGDDKEVSGIAASFGERLVPGSHVVISHVTSGDLTEDQVRQGRGVYGTTTAGGIFPRTLTQIRGLFDGLEMLEPGLVPVYDWRPDSGDVVIPPGAGAITVGAVGRVL